jgi:hypothetical protein
MLYGQDPAYAISQLEKVLGRLPDRVKHDYMGEQSHTHGDLTELLMSRASKVVTDQVTGLLVKSYVSPITNFLMPIRQMGPMDGIQLQWMEMHFDDGLAPQVEVEGLARLYTHNKTRRGARMVRRGVAVKVEEGFFLTPEGRRLWGNQIEQLAAIIQRTNEYDAFVTLLQTAHEGQTSASDMGGPYNHIYGAREGMSRYDRLMLQRDWFGIVNKAEDSRGLVTCVSQLRTTMVKQGVEPNALIVPPNMMNVYYTGSDDLYHYSSAGPAVADNRAAAEEVAPRDGVRTRRFQGLQVVDTYVQRATVGGQDGPGDLLTVPVQIGEYYPMSTNHFLVDEDEIFNFRGKKRDIRIFNEDQSRIVPVAFEDAIANSLRWDKNGKLDQDRHLSVSGPDIFKYQDKTTTKLCEVWGHVEGTWWGEGFVTARRVAQSILSKFDDKERDALDNDVLKFKSTYRGGGNAIPAGAPQSVRSPTGMVDQSSNAYPAALDAYADTFWMRVMKIVNRVTKNAGKGTPVVTEDDIKEFVFEDFSYNKVWKDQKWDSVIESLRPAEKVALAVFLRTGITKNSCRMLHRADVYLPFDFVLARPYMTYYASSMIMMLAGRETGEILVNKQSFQMTSNNGDRTLYANYFYYGKAVVWANRNVLVAPNVFIQDYVKGNNTSFINDDDLGEIHDNSGLVERTNSVFAFLTMAGDEPYKANVLDIRGHNNDLEIPGRDPGKAHYATAAYYDELLRLDPLSLADPMSDFVDYEDINLQTNSICFLGHTEDWKGQVLFQNTGHLGPHTYNQCNLSRKPGHYSAIRGSAANVGVMA